MDDGHNGKGFTELNTTSYGGYGGLGSSEDGIVYMNSKVLQRLYIQEDGKLSIVLLAFFTSSCLSSPSSLTRAGLLAYTSGSTPSTFPRGSYPKSFNMTGFSIGSCVDCFSQLYVTLPGASENSRFYTCKDTTPGATGNLTYVNTPKADVSKCMSFLFLMALRCYPGSDCSGANAYEYA